MTAPDPAPAAGRSLVALAVFIGSGLAVGALGGLVTGSSLGDWYPALVKPAFNPPDSVFAPVWTALFVVMSVAAWRVWRRGGIRLRQVELGLYSLQLGLNLLWSVLFFGLRRPDLALAEIAVLLTAIGWTGIRFARCDRLAGWLMAPYGAWVAFALVLNAAIWRLN